MNILFLNTSSQVSIYSSDSDSLDDDAEETALESYQTPFRVHTHQGNVREI